MMRVVSSRVCRLQNLAVPHDQGTLSEQKNPKSGCKRAAAGRNANKVFKCLTRFFVRGMLAYGPL